QTDVVMVPARRNKSRTSAVTMCQLKAEDAAIKCQRAIQVGHLEMHVANANVGMNRLGVGHFSRKFQVIEQAQAAPSSKEKLSGKRRGAVAATQYTTFLARIPFESFSGLITSEPNASLSPKSILE